MPTSPDRAITPHARAAFLAELRLRGNVTRAAAETDHPRESWYNLRGKDEAFADQWGQAIEEATERLEMEARRRAEEGTERPVFQRGEQVGYVREYSDTLMICLLKAHSPKYRDKVGLEHSGPDGTQLKVRWESADGDD